MNKRIGSVQTGIVSASISRTALSSPVMAQFEEKYRSLKKQSIFFCKTVDKIQGFI